MTALEELYQEVIIDHNQHPRNHRVMAEASRSAEGYNPLCGDKLTVYIHLNADVIDDISFKGCGCAISQASASLMTEVIKGKTLAVAHAIFLKFHTMIMLGEALSDPSLGKLTALAGVRGFPARVKCATLAWHTLESTLNDSHAIVSTE